jgi:hypothetical protein
MVGPDSTLPAISVHLSGGTACVSLWSCVMPHRATLVPEDTTHRDIYLVLDDFGSLAGYGVKQTRRERTARG